MGEDFVCYVGDNAYLIDVWKLTVSRATGICREELH